jgi:hypothetical protein
VVDGIKGFRRVQKEQKRAELLIGVLHSAIEKLIDSPNVPAPRPARDKALLGVVEDILKVRGDGDHHRLSYKAIVRVGNTNRARVSGQVRALLREKKEEPVIEAGGGGRPSGSAIQTWCSTGAACPTTDL